MKILKQEQHVVFFMFIYLFQTLFCFFYLNFVFSPFVFFISCIVGEQNPMKWMTKTGMYPFEEEWLWEEKEEEVVDKVEDVVEDVGIQINQIDEKPTTVDVEEDKEGSGGETSEEKEPVESTMEM